MPRAFDPSKCGTARGRDQHRHRGEKPCEPCREAWNVVSRERLARLRESGWVRPDREPPKLRRVPSVCTDCGKSIKASTPSPVCSQCRSRSKRGIYIRDVERLAIYDRDEWCCGICSDPVDRELSGHHQWGPTLDHIIPRSLGGSDDPDNLRLAHRACNSRRGAKVA